MLLIVFVCLFCDKVMSGSDFHETFTTGVSPASVIICLQSLTVSYIYVTQPQQNKKTICEG